MIKQSDSANHVQATSLPQLLSADPLDSESRTTVRVLLETAFSSHWRHGASEPEPVWFRHQRADFRRPLSDYSVQNIFVYTVSRLQ